MSGVVEQAKEWGSTFRNEIKTEGYRVDANGSNGGCLQEDFYILEALKEDCRHCCYVIEVANCSH